MYRNDIVTELACTGSARRGGQIPASQRMLRVKTLSHPMHNLKDTIKIMISVIIIIRTDYRIVSYRLVSSASRSNNAESTILKNRNRILDAA